MGQLRTRQLAGKWCKTKYFQRIRAGIFLTDMGKDANTGFRFRLIYAQQSFDWQ